MIRTLKPAQLVFDTVVATLCLLLVIYVSVSSPSLGTSPVAGIGMSAALGVRRISPPIALGIAWLTSLVQVFADIGFDPSNLAILPVLYATASYGDRITKWAGLVSSGVGALIIAIYLPLDAGYAPDLGSVSILAQLPSITLTMLITFLSFLAVFVLSWTFGLLARTWRASREAGQARIIAERQRLDAEREAAREHERTRIARDMHDVVAHSLAVVIAQADGARYAKDADPDAVGTALEAISTTAREALADVRVLLAQLRHNQGESPQPVLADLDRLLDQLRASGLPIRFEQVGEPVAVGTSQELAAYRIVQEALTNALRHGDVAKQVDVRFDWADELGIRVSSAILAPEHPQGVGHGIAGMRERAELAGGWFDAGPEAGRWVVRAGLPSVFEPVTA
ncbi:sensor histidine kinase [Cryobacterium sp. BB736]|uniref:sensor histidine kinase n=1 Tax=Cryobacterium sp. BB736 TaxID=2746963 RepID=UPI00187521CC|nr:histidine kinase [Cryobacterium sp. BB736]